MRLLRLFVAAVTLLAPSWAAAQSACNNIAYDKVLTEAQWNYCFQQKQNVLGYTALNKGGDTMLGKLVTTPSSTAQSGFALAIGLAPTSPNDGDIWTTSSGLFVRIGGATIGPLGQGAPTSASANLVYAGPTTGLPAAPSFRSLVAADLPVATGSAFGAVKPDGTTITVSGGVISSAGASATSIQSGVTNFLSATSGNCAYNNAGKVGDKPCITKVNIVPFNTASGAITYTPTAGLVYAQIECVGAGGAGGGANSSNAGGTAAGGGGGSGAYSKAIATAAAIGASQSGSIGAGGTGSTGAGTSGGDTNLGTLCVAKGGSGAPQATNGGNNGGLGGLASGGTGDVKFNGNGGQAGLGTSANATIGVGGAGAGSFFGGGGSSITLSGGGAPGTSCGGAGAGGTIAGAASQTGGNGFRGCVIVTEFING